MNDYYKSNSVRPPLINFKELAEISGLNLNAINYRFKKDGKPLPVILRNGAKKYYNKADLMGWAAQYT